MHSNRRKSNFARYPFGRNRQSCTGHCESPQSVPGGRSIGRLELLNIRHAPKNPSGIIRNDDRETQSGNGIRCGPPTPPSRKPRNPGRAECRAHRLVARGSKFQTRSAIELTDRRKGCAAEAVSHLRVGIRNGSRNVVTEVAFRHGADLNPIGEVQMRHRRIPL